MLVFLVLTILYWDIMGKVSAGTFLLAFLIGLVAVYDSPDGPQPKICNFLFRYSIFTWLFLMFLHIGELVLYYITSPLLRKIKSKFNYISHKIDKSNEKLDKRLNKDK